MPTYPDPAVLYPEVTAAASLAAALQAVTVELGLSVPVVKSTSLFGAATLTTVAHRRSLEVSASPVERRWFIRGCDRDQSLALIEGGTPDLAQVAHAAQAWHATAIPDGRADEATAILEQHGLRRDLASHLIDSAGTGGRDGAQCRASQSVTWVKSAAVRPANGSTRCSSAGAGS